MDPKSSLNMPRTVNTRPTSKFTNSNFERMLARQTYCHQELTVEPRGSHLCHMVEITSKVEIRSWLKCMVLLLMAHHCCRQCSLVVSSAVKCMVSSREVEYMGRRTTAIKTSQWHMWAFRAMEQKL